jgi:hypothetical protein
MNRKSVTPLDDDRLTPEDERSLAFGIAQGNAGLTFGPFEKGGLSLRAFIKARERTRRVSIKVPTILYDYFQTEANRFGMTSGDFMSTILQIHKFKDQDHQLILLAVDAAASAKKKSGPKSKKS